MPTREPEIPSTQQVSIIAKSHPMIVESHSDIELQANLEHQTENVELPNKDTHSDTDVEHTIVED